MSADPQPSPAPARPIPVSSPADYEPPPRFRWVAPLCIGVAVGAVIGGGVTFTMMTLSTKSRGELVARQFNADMALRATPGAERFAVSQDTTSELGNYNRRSGNTNMIRRRLTITGEVADANAANAIANQLKTALDAELTRAGAFSSGGGSTSQTGGNEYTGSFESTYYTRDGRRGQLDLEVVAKGTTFRATVYLFEAR